MRNTVLSLRLLKKGHVSGNCIFYVLVSEKRKRFASVEWSCEGAHLGAKPWILGKYVLHFEEIPALKEILQKIQSIHFVERKRLRLTCKRFQRAYEEDDFEDRLIDFMIAFEALLVRKEIPGSHFGQKIANGCSDVLGKNNEEREEIRSFLSEACYIRNRIVHGAEYRKPRVDKKYGMFEFILKIEDYLRKSIKKLLD